MEKGFPEGLRVLAVVDDPACQKTLHKNLIKWKSRVRMCMQAQEAVNVIEEGKEEFDIVISDTKLPDMDGFMFVELVRRLNTKLPIILLYVSGELKKKERMLELGACDFVWKPIRVKELRESITLQHHLSRKRTAAVSSEEGSTSTAALLPIKEKGKGKEVDEESADVAPPLKKQRMTWNQLIHQKFVQVVNQLGLDARPSKIVKMMDVEGLSREQVSSHLQKYRERLNKEKRRNEVVVAADNGGERVGFGDTSMSYNQHSTLIPDAIPPHNNWDWNWNGGAAWPSSQSPVSHNPGFPTREAGNYEILPDFGVTGTESSQHKPWP